MRYRKLTDDADKDYQFGRAGIFFVDSPEGVAQAIGTRLRLWTKEWFLDKREGTPYEELILGYSKQGTRDIAVKERILGTQGVVEILAYQSNVSQARKMTVSATVQTQYGVAALNLEL